MSDLIIDGNRLMMSLADWWYSSFGQEETEEAKAIRAVMDKVEESLDAFKIADVQTVVHGEWKDYTEDGYVECPYCHSATNCDGNADELHYCFSCGANLIMDKRKGADE